MKKLISIAVLLAVFVAGSVWAENPREVKKDKKEIRQDVKEVHQSKKCLDELTALMRMWSNANAAGEKRKARQLEQAIYNLLLRDINASAWAVWQAEQEVKHSRVETVGGRSLHGHNADDKADYRDDRRDCVKSRRLLEAKEHLVGRLNDSKSFTYKYRLLADYQELLRRELGYAKTEWAEDIRELKKDKR